MGMSLKIVSLVITILGLGAWAVLGGPFYDDTILGSSRISRLTTQGNLFLVICIVALMVNCGILISEDRKNLSSEKRLNDDLEATRIGLNTANESLKLSAVKQSDANDKLDKVMAAIERKGFEYDPTSNTIREHELKTPVLQRIINLLNKHPEVKSVGLGISPDSNGQKVHNQLQTYLQENGYHVFPVVAMGLGSLDEFDYSFYQTPPPAYHSITIGRFK
jgi:hypothetical protein